MKKLPLIIKVTTSREKAEKVVNELKIPVIKNNLIPSLVASEVWITSNNKPKRNDPETLIIIVAKGK